MSTTTKSPADTGALSTAATIIAVVVSIAGLICCIAMIVIAVCVIKKLNRPRGQISDGMMHYPYPPYPAHYPGPYGPPPPLSQNLPPPYPGTPASVPVAPEMTKVSD